MTTLPIVTAENYFSPEIEMAYMGSSQFKAFEKCEAAALAMCRGEYVPERTTALLIGLYVDAHFEGALDVFRDKHPELFRRDGGLKAEYVQAERLIERLERDDLFMMLMSGEKQVIRTGEIAGVPFKIKIDSLLDGATVQKIIEKYPQTANVFLFGDGAIVDGKIMRDLSPVWSDSEHQHVSFVEAWGYDVQGAIYQAVEGRMLPFVLAVGTKETEPDMAAIHVSDEDLAAKLAEIEDTVPRYQAIKMGKIAPVPCGKCAWCRRSKRLRSIIDYRDL